MAVLVLPMLYLFFGVVAGVRARRLEDPAALLRRSGFRRLEQASWLGGFVRSEVWLEDDDAVGRSVALSDPGSVRPGAAAPE